MSNICNINRMLFLHCGGYDYYRGCKLLCQNRRTRRCLCHTRRCLCHTRRSCATPGGLHNAPLGRIVPYPALLWHTRRFCVRTLVPYPAVCFQLSLPRDGCQEFRAFLADLNSSMHTCRGKYLINKQIYSIVNTETIYFSNGSFVLTLHSQGPLIFQGGPHYLS